MNEEEEIIDLAPDQIEKETYNELIQHENTFVYPTIIGSDIKGGTINSRRVSTIVSGINDDGDFIKDIINTKFDTSTKEILSDFTFGESGAIKMITDDNNGLWISPTGILGKKSGNTTFSIDTSGNATFSGELSAATGTLGTITAGSLTGVTITGGTIQTASEDGRIILSGQSANALKIMFQNDDDQLANITVQDRTDDEQRLRFDIYKVSTGSSRVVYMNYNNGKIDFYSTNSGTIGTSDYHWGNIYGGGLFLKDSIEINKSTGSAGLVLKSGTGANSDRGHLKLDDITLSNQKLSLMLTNHTESGVSYRYLYFEYTSDGIYFYPNGASKGSCGTNTNYWKYIYGDNIRYKDLDSFDNHDDISLIKKIKEKETTKGGKKRNVWDYDSMPEETKSDGFYSAGAVQGLTIGTLKQLIDRVEKIENKLNNIKI